MDYRKCEKCNNLYELNKNNFRIIKKIYFSHTCKQCLSNENKIRENNYKLTRNENDYRKFNYPEYKKCTQCKIEKSTNEFRYRKKRDYYTYNSSCKECEKQWQKEIQSPRYYQQHKEEIKQKAKIWAMNNRDKINENSKNRYKNDINFRLKQLIRKHLKRLLNGDNTNHKQYEYLGCTIDFLRKWFEYQFIDGMNWDNHGDVWHIDHVLPLSYFNFENEESFYIACNWRNLKPLDKYENLSKSAKVDIELYNNQLIKAKKFKKEFNNATPSNCGKLLKSSTTTSFEKSYEGTQVMTDLYGKNVEELDNPQPSSYVRYDKNMEKVQRLYGGGLDESNQFK